MQRPVSGPVELAVAELRRQFERSHAMVQLAEQALRAAGKPLDATALELLSAASAELSQVRHLARVERGLVIALQLLEERPRGMR